MTRPVIVAGDLVDGVWCPNCAAPVRIRIPLHLASRHRQPVAHLEVCVSCGHHYIPATPQVTVEELPKQWHRPRPWLAYLWWLHRRTADRAGRPHTGCSLQDCPRPGWWECAWIEAVDLGTIRHVFCTGRHRRMWLAERLGIPDTLTGRR